MNDTSLNSFKLTRTPSALKVFAAVWAILLVLSFVFIIVTPWTQSVQGTGVVTALSPMLRPQTVSAGFDARLVAWKVREGEKVMEGQIIAELAEYRPEYLDPQQLVRAQSQRNAVSLKRQAAEAQLRSYDSLLAALRQVGNAKLASDQLRRVEAAPEVDVSGRRLIAAERQAILTAKQNLERVSSLHAQGLRSTRDLELAERDMAKAEGEVEAKMLETELKRAQALEKIANLDGELLKAETDLSRMQERTQQRDVRSPVTGHVVRVYGVGAGHTFKSGEAMAIIAPDSADQAVELFVSDNDAPLITLGRPVRLQFSGWPALQMSGWPSVAVGTFAGRVAAIDAASDGRGRVRILAEPDHQAIGSGRDVAWPPSPTLRAGTQVSGWVLLQRVPLWFELWRRFNAFPPSFQSAQTPSPSKK